MTGLSGHISTLVSAMLHTPDIQHAGFVGGFFAFLTAYNFALNVKLLLQLYFNRLVRQKLNCDNLCKFAHFSSSSNIVKQVDCTE